MSNFLHALRRTSILVFFGAVHASAADFTIKADLCTSWSWDQAANTLTCNGAAPTTGPASCNALTPTPTAPTPGATFSLAATCQANGGTITQYEFSGPVDAQGNATVLQTSVSSSASGIVAPNAVGNYAYRVRAAKSNALTNAAEWGSYFTRSVSVSTASVSAPSNCSINPSSASLNAAQLFTASCSNTNGNQTYAWTKDGSSAGCNSATCSITFGTVGTHSVGVTVCNGSGPETCASATQNVAVSSPTAPTGNISCTNISGITNTVVMPGQGQYLDLAAQQGWRLYSQNFGNFGAGTAIVVAFRTPDWASTYGGHSAIAELDVTPNDRLAILSTEPCATPTSSNILNAGTGPNATVQFAVGNPIAGLPTLKQNTVYYVTYTNRARNWATGEWTDNTCRLSDCSAMVDVKLTR